MPSTTDAATLKANLLATPLPDEEQAVNTLVQLLASKQSTLEAAGREASRWIERLRQTPFKQSSLETFLQQYGLTTPAGQALLSLAEALLRVPDSHTAALLVRDKLNGVNWDEQAGGSLFTSASNWGLKLGNKLLGKQEEERGGFGRWLGDRTEDAMVKGAQAGMRMLSGRFVLGENIDEALDKAKPWQKESYLFSFDMLGEAAMYRGDAVRYTRSYHEAISVVSQRNVPGRQETPSISVKLSALCPRYEARHHARVLRELGAALFDVAEHAVSSGIQLTIDAEESERLELSLELLEALLRRDPIRQHGGVGLAVQAYSPRALPLLHYVCALARELGMRLPVRLVKGAYWDTEIRNAQLRGLQRYPVFTRKASTDLSYLACAQFMLEHPEAFYPQFATHNAHTIASILAMAPPKADYEFQRLHGMGEDLYQLVRKEQPSLRCRIYAPVGEQRELLPYLVRRLQENGASSSFVQQAVDKRIAPADITASPLRMLEASRPISNDRLPLPPQLYGHARRNSIGINWGATSERQALLEAIAAHGQRQWQAGHAHGSPRALHNPADRNHLLGHCFDSTAEGVTAAMDSAARAFSGWAAQPAGHRADLLDRIADQLEQARDELLALLAFEAGKQLQDGVDEWREAVDFCRYYAERARADLATPRELPGPTGERNTLAWQGRGVFACISPWNFPLAIFVGQIAAALAAGNTVVAKPAEQTPLVAWRAVELMRQAGLAEGVLHCLPGSGRVLGPTLLQHPALAGVAFTGSLETARTINALLQQRPGEILPLIAETGGVNVMLVDNTALPEQVVQDVIRSAFNSAGQRCSALRVLYLQQEIAQRVTDMLDGAMRELVVGAPQLENTDIGPVIDQAARDKINRYIDTFRNRGDLLFAAPIPPALAQQGHFVEPTAVRVSGIADVPEEVFGPVLHIATFKHEECDQVVDAINASGYGLTFGLHSRNESWCQSIAQRVRAGNVYINRNMVGAVVGTQPFGGRGLSGTGPKAGGPHYLYRFATEVCTSHNLCAAGTNAALLALEKRPPLP